jgi:AraC-like DNA-binding protein
MENRLARPSRRRFLSSAVAAAAARQGLLAGTRRSTTITAKASQWGFWPFGEFSRAYKECFGELPSETLRRAW